MSDLLIDVKGKELIVRKRLASFLEKLLFYLGYDIRHDLYKKIIYCEEMVKSPMEEMVKNYYDAYTYLLNNHKRAFTCELLKKFFFILDGKIDDEEIMKKIVRSFFNNNYLPGFESSIKFHLEAYEHMKDFKPDKRMIVSLMLFNYSLLKNNIPSLHFFITELPDYEDARDSYLNGDDKNKIYNFFLKILPRSKFQDKTFYQNLKSISFQDLSTEIMKDKEWLQNKNYVKELWIYGSFAKGDERIDSDIDLLISFSLDARYIEKKESVDYIAKYYLNKFNRFIDICEVSNELTDEFLKQIDYIKKIF